MPNWNFRGVFSIYFSPEATAKLQWAGDIIFFRVLRSSFRVRHENKRRRRDEEVEIKKKRRIKKRILTV